MTRIFFLLLTIILGFSTIYCYAKNKPKRASIISTILTILSLIVAICPTILEQEKVEPSIILDSNSLELISTDEYNLRATTSPQNCDIEWSSDNKNIISVDDNGYVKAINEGEATVTATIIYKNIEYTDACKILVSNPVINLDSSILLYVGEIKKISTTTIPKKTNILWNSSNTDVAIVNDKGIIKGISEGTATITATMVYNNITYSTDCIITVKALLDNNNSSGNYQDNVQSNEQEINNTSNTNELEDGKTALSSAIYIKNDQLHGYIINSDYSTLQGNGFFEGYIATSAGVNYNEVISVCNYSPFELIYNLEGKYNKLTGEIAFDDISASQNDVVGVTSLFKGEAEIVFYVDDVEKDRVSLLTTDFPKPFASDVSGGEKLSITFSFPYSNFVLENFDKYFNIINAYLE